MAQNPISPEGVAIVRSSALFARASGAACFVDNTNTTVAEIAPYYAIAEAYGCDVTIVRVLAEFRECLRWNTHKVPDGTMLNMAQNLYTEKLLPRWRQTIVCSDTKWE
jgi:hypothetical protein